MKFRMILLDRGWTRPEITVGGNPRITRVGRWLKQSKVDELPQLSKVHLGDMSLFGPSSEVASYVTLYPPEARNEGQSVCPSIADQNSIEFSGRATVVGGSSDPHRTYLDEILPNKLFVRLSRVFNYSVPWDFRMIFKSLSRIVRCGSG
jgi:lipopolysaccharide/colanic/teichoic acid biosynthesis glycosyltransferase